jgi:predicted DNA-binding transcriptional regulator YafY
LPLSPPTGKVFALLELLQSAPGATAAELAGRLSIDERTVRRYATHLCELGLPVRARRGRRGGFRLEPGYRLPPLILTNEEALAVVLGLVATSRLAERAPVPATAGRLGDESAGGGAPIAATAALTKIMGVLPLAVACQVRTLLTPAASGSGSAPAAGELGSANAASGSGSV